ncbi:MAG TPA: acetyl-CoA hydrolase/transferase family protein [Tissierellia bacterium]|nr:acetyl-CoA hydrolase/transferase family protein [Tissierellia bacterium]
MDRIRCEKLKDKIVSAEEAAKLIKDGDFVGASGFTPAGYPKAVPLALAKRVDEGEKIQIDLMTGASVGPELDGVLSERGIIRRRYPYQTNAPLRNSINSGNIKYNDIHLSHSPQYLRYGFLGKMDVAIIEAVTITENGGIVPSTSVGNSNVFVECAEKVIVEINTSQPLSLEGIHDIYSPLNPPRRESIPINKVSDRIGTTYIPCPLEKIAAIVITDIPDKTNKVAPIDEVSRQMADNLIKFLKSEVDKGRLPKNLLPLQSGVGSVANAVLGGLCNSDFTDLNIYSEVLQDSVIDLIDCGKVKTASATSLTISPDRIKDFTANFSRYKDHIILRPEEISNNPEVIRKLGVISMNTAIEVDIYGNVNSTHIMGSKMMNGIGGSGDFTRNAYISIFTTASTAKDGKISSIVPMVSHVDHTEHDVMVIVTEKGVADLRGLSPKERAEAIIENCAHEDYKEMLWDYFNRAKEATKNSHTPHILIEGFSWHERFMKTGTMKKP